MNDHTITHEEVHITGYAKPTHYESIIAGIDEYIEQRLDEAPTLIVYNATLYHRLISGYARLHKITALLSNDNYKRERENLRTAANMIAINPDDTIGRIYFERRQHEERRTRSALILTVKDAAPPEQPPRLAHHRRPRPTKRTRRNRHPRPVR